jgi:hypothetical protein
VKKQVGANRAAACASASAATLPQQGSVGAVRVEMPVLEGVPLSSALANAIKLHKQMVVASHCKPVFLGEESLATTYKCVNAHFASVSCMLRFMLHVTMKPHQPV